MNQQETKTETVALYPRTDLACEAPSAERIREEGGEGLTYVDYQCGALSVARLSVETERAAKKLGKPIGTYVTVTPGNPMLLSDDEHASLSTVLASELREMAENITEKRITPAFRVLVAGLGNAQMASDALGPRTARGITVTRHIKDSEDEALITFRNAHADVSVVTPGVLADTGIEAAELICGAAETVHPDLLIVIDALAARSCERLTATVQISDTGLHPGAGIGNHRLAINRETVGCPVIALGVPTVVDSSTLVYDALNRAGISDGEISPALSKILESGTSFFVSPKDIDALVEEFASLLSEVINRVFSSVGATFG